MTPPTRVDLSPALTEWFKLAQRTPALTSRYKKAKKAIKNMRDVGPSHPGFHTHKMENLPGPGGVPIWNSYVENHAPNAWRMYWIRENDGVIYVLSIGPHDHSPGQQTTP